MVHGRIQKWEADIRVLLQVKEEELKEEEDRLLSQAGHQAHEGVAAGQKQSSGKQPNAPSSKPNLRGSHADDKYVPLLINPCDIVRFPRRCGLLSNRGGQDVCESEGIWLHELKRNVACSQGRLRTFYL